jgi:hypothetical protein
VIVGFVDIGGIVGDHCSSFLFITKEDNKVMLQYTTFQPDGHKAYL